MGPKTRHPRRAWTKRRNRRQLTLSARAAARGRHLTPPGQADRALEAVITSLIGATLGLGLGVLFALAISRPLEAEGFALTFPWMTLALLVAGAAVAGMLASLWPARRAARLDVLRVLAYE